MNGRELNDLQEAYMSIVENGFNRSRIDRNLEKIERKKSTSRKSSQNKSFFGPTTSKRNVLSGQMSKSERNLNKEQVDLYDILLSHLLDEELDDNTKKRAIRHIKDTKKLLRTMAREIDYNYYPEPEGYEPESEKKIKKKTQREQVDLYDIILFHLLDEGYAETPEAAEVMMVNMSEEWRDSIMEGYKRFPYKKVEDKIHKKEADNPSGRGTPQTINMGKVIRHFRGEVRRTEKRENSPQISKAKEAENRRRGNKG